MIESIVMTHDTDEEIGNGISQFYHLKKSKVFLSHGFVTAIRVDCENDFSEYYLDNGKTSLFIVGEIVNLETIRYLLLTNEPNVLNFTASEVVFCLYNYFGSKGISKLEGMFSLFFTHVTGEIEIYTDPFGHMPVYVYFANNGRWWVTSEIKTLLSVNDIQLRLKPVESFEYGKKLPSNFSIFQNTEKLAPGMRVFLKRNISKFLEIEQESYHHFSHSNLLILSKEKSINVLDHLLNGFVFECLKGKSRVALPLSGGLDSSIIGSIASKATPNLSTFSIGTEFSNEFSHARKVSAFIGSNQNEYVLDINDLLNGMINMAFYNEIYDALCLEIQSPIYYLYTKIYTVAKTILTGFGADMFFGGHLDVNMNPNLVNSTLWENICRIRWTGEYSPFAAQSLGLSVYHPFCQNSLVSFAVALDPNLKIAQGENKHILRELARKKKYLPIDICNRKKIAIEQASSLHNLFSNYLKLETCFSYTEKNHFTYQIFKQMFEYRMSKDEILHNELRKVPL